MNLISKQDIRENVLNKRKSLSDDFVKINSEVIINKILNLKEFKKAKNIGLFAGLKGEPDLLPLLELCKDKNFYFPKVISSLTPDPSPKGRGEYGCCLEFHLIKSLNDLKKGSFGILEPRDKEKGEGNKSYQVIKLSSYKVENGKLGVIARSVSDEAIQCNELSKKNDKLLLDESIVKSQKLRFKSETGTSYYDELLITNYGLKNLDLILIPGIAFTEDGKRIGFGKGFYDKFLNSLTPNPSPKGRGGQCGNNILKIGVCFDFQIFNNLCQNEWDVRMDKIIYN